MSDRTPGQIAYEAHRENLACAYTHDLWIDQPEIVRDAWEAAAEAVLQADRDERGPASDRD